MNLKKINKKMEEINENKEPIQIKSFLGKKRIGNVTKYLIEWIDKKFTYEPKENLINCNEILCQLDKGKKRIIPSENFNNNDSPLRIVSVKNIKNEFLYEIQWKKREDGFAPQNYFASGEFLFENYRNFFLNFLTNHLFPLN